MKRELTPKEILFQFHINKGDKETKLKDIPQIKSAYKKIKTAISIKEENFNLYIVDSFSKYRLNELIKYIEGIYEKKQSPKDICYVTYEDIRRPEPIFLCNGNGVKLKEAIDNLKNKYFDAVLEFYNTTSDKEKDRIIEDVNSKRSAYISELIELARAEGFDLKSTTGGFAFIPLKEGEAMTEKEYEDLSEKNKDSIVVRVGFLKKKAELILDKIKNIEILSLRKLKSLYKEYLSRKMADDKEDLLLDFLIDDQAYDYLERIFTLIEKDLVGCYSINIEEDHEEINKILNNYEINILVDNNKQISPRVLYENEPSISNLLGNIEYESTNGGYTTDLSLITPGSLLLANEGCLIIRLNQLIINPNSYYALKKVLLTGKVNIDSNRSYLDLLSISGLKPESIPVNVKIILIGDYESYDVLYNGDEDFRMLFPLRSEFDSCININKEYSNNIYNFVLERFKDKGIETLSDDVFIEVMRYLSKKAESKDKIIINTEILDNLIVLLKDEMKENKKSIIEKEHIVNVIYKDEVMENQIIDMYKENKIILSVKDRKIGSINGLAVIDLGYHKFGKPLRITCITSKGSGRIVDIQRESNLSGKIHEKSINILGAILSNILSPYITMPVDFHVSFEQTYGLIDGDSASVSELLCIISAFSKVPINQNIAVTGSLSIFGEVQPIGGVNEKIEGFYKVCKLTGNLDNMGVLIPGRNIDELVLSPEVEEAIKKGIFHIYVMDSLEDAIEVMMDVTLEYVVNKIKIQIEKYK